MSGPDQHQARRKYEELAPAYDRLVRLSARMRRLAVERLELRRGVDVLDVGCGTGLSFPLIEERIGAEGGLIGVDLSPAMLAKARERVEHHGWENVTLVESAVEDAAIPTVNASVWWVARRYVTTFEGFRRPWNHLESLVPDLRIEPLFLGGAYLAFGTMARSDRSAEAT